MSVPPAIDLPERVRYRDVPLSHYVDLLNAHEPWSIARWSDGDWPCVLGETRANTDGHARSPKLRADLIETLLSRPTHTMAIQPHLLRQPGMPQRVHDWLVDHDLRFDWVNGDTFCNALIRDELGPFIEALRKRAVVMVGPERLMGLDLFPVVGKVAVPLLNCHDECDRVECEIATHLTERLGAVVSISAGMSANVLVTRLRRRFPGATIMDLGSLWEPFVNVANRRYHVKVLERMKS